MTSEESSSVDSGMSQFRYRLNQSRLFWAIFEDEFDEEQFESNQDILDKDITMAVCDYKKCKAPFKTRFNEDDEDIDDPESTKGLWKERLSECIASGQCEHDAYVEHFLTCRLVHFAAMSDDSLPVLKYLHKKGCDLNVETEEEKFTPLCVAVNANQIKTVKYLMSKEVDLNNGDLSPLKLSVKFNNKDIFNLLVGENDIDFNRLDRRGYSLLGYCVGTNTEYIEPLLKAGASPNVVNVNGSSPLMNAVSARNVDLVKLLIRYGANVNHVNRRGEVALVNPVYVENTELCSVLLDAGADPNFQTKEDGNSLLLLSSYDGSLEIVQLLMKYGGNASSPNKLGYTPLHIAAWNGHLDCVKAFLAAGVAFDTQTTDRNTPLALAAHGGHLNVIEALLPLKCNVNNTDKDDDTPLLYSAFNGSLKACELLILNGANPDAKNSVDATALWNAVYMSKKGVVKLLLLNNVKLEVKSRGIDQHAQTDHVVYIYDEPKSPLWVAVAKNNPEIALLLISAGYNIYNEDWLVDHRFPQNCDERFCNLLTSYIQNAPKLVTRCRNFFRDYFGLAIFEKVKVLPIPESLKSYLTLSDLQSLDDDMETESVDGSEEYLV